MGHGDGTGAGSGAGRGRPPEVDRETLARIVLEAPVVLFAGRVAEATGIEPVWVCANARRILGYEVARCYEAEWWLEGVHPDDRDRVVAARLRVPDAGSVDLEYRFRDGAGAYRHLQAELRDVRGELDGVDLVGSWTDITRRKNLESELFRTRKSRAVSTLAGGIAHDYNNLLTTILGSVDLLEGELEEGHPAAGHLDEVRRAARWGSDLTRMLLHVGGQARSSHGVVPVPTLVGAVLEGWGAELPEGISLSVEVPDDLPAVRGDEEHLRRALSELLRNAALAVKGEGRIRIDAAAVEGSPEGTELKAGRYVRVRVRDDGTGIHAGDLERIFEPFFSTAPPGRGTGLGLALVERIARESGGTVQVRSEEGEGTTFSLFLPVAEG